MSRFFFCFFTLLTATFLTAQTIPGTENICFFQDAKTGKPITIVNDSLVYKGELKNPSILKHTDYPETLKRYGYHFIINKHTYLVNDGCGPVLEYRNDSIVRIDNSFLQKNQYGASPFVYNNQICLFGGYGLFADKNIITQFDFKTKEWMRLYEKKEKPSDRNSALNFYNNKGFYLFGGWTNNNPFDNTFQKDPKLWYLDYSTLQWYCIGNYNEQLKNINNEFAFQDSTKTYIITRLKIIEIDYTNNNVRWYKNDTSLFINKIIYINSTKTLYFLLNLPAKNELLLIKKKLSNLLKYPIKTENLYYSPWQEYAFPSLGVLVLLLLIFGIYKLIVYQKGKCFVFHQTKNKFYYKSKFISNLDFMEKKILIYLFQNNNTYIQLNQLNSFFEKESPDNFTNIIKKRDLVFSSLLVKLNACVMHGENPLILMKKNDVDKRIKEIRLNPIYFNIK